MVAIKLGNPQSGTPIRTDNSTASGTMKGAIKQRHSKAIDMRFYWLKDRFGQKMFQIYWIPGNINLANYFSKHHPTAHVKKVQNIYLHKPGLPWILQGCIKALA